MNSFASEFDTIKILEELVSIKSDTSTKLEIDIEQRIFSYLSSIEYFKKTKNFGLEKIPEDYLGRKIVWAFYKPQNNKTKKTIIFLNHHDAVDDEDYGNLKAISRNSKKLKESLSHLDFCEDIEKDLDSSNWFFGRGSADMKAGIAIQLNLMKTLTEYFDKNILFVSVPDEETLSLGMRHCSKFLKDLKDRHDLEYSIIINSEPHTRENPKKPTIYEGSVGKTMIAIYVKGKKCHIGEVFQGFNPSLILSNIIINTELNMELSDFKHGESSPPPSWSFARDFKPCYDASIPEAAGGYLSFLTLSKTPKEILLSVKKICEKSFDSAIHQYEESLSKYSGYKGTSKYTVKVKLYEELLNELKILYGDKLNSILENSYSKISEKIKNNDISVPESNFKVLESLCNHLPDKEPMVIVAISPPYYPHVSNKNNNLNSISIDYNSVFSEEIDKKEYFMGISDLSYAAIENFEDTAPYIKNNMPLWKNELYSIPFDEMKDLSIPVINIGPWGKDLHKLTERVFVPDLNITTPKLIKELIDVI